MSGCFIKCLAENGNDVISKVLDGYDESAQLIEIAKGLYNWRKINTCSISMWIDIVRGRFKSLYPTYKLMYDKINSGIDVTDLTSQERIVNTASDETEIDDGTSNTLMNNTSKNDLYKLRNTTTASDMQKVETTDNTSNGTTNYNATNNINRAGTSATTEKLNIGTNAESLKKVYDAIFDINNELLARVFEPYLSKRV